MTDTSCRTGFRTMSFRNMHAALAMHCLSVLRVRCRVARAMSVANELAEVKTVIARDFTPALPGLVRCNNVVKALT